MLYRLLQSVARAIMYNVSGLSGTNFVVFENFLCTLDREYYRALFIVYLVTSLPMIR